MEKIFLMIAVFFLTSIPAFAGSYPDVPEDHPNYTAIEYLDSNDIIDGYQDGTFGPEDLVTRAQAMKMVVGALGIDYLGSYSNVFPDVDEEEWYFPYVMAGYNKEIISGYPDGTFKPGDNVNLAELLKIIVLGAEVELEAVAEDVYIDVSKDVWYAPHALFARNNNLVSPDDYGYLHAEQYMTRAGFAEVVYRMMIVLENNGEPYPLDLGWLTYSSKNLPFEIKYDPKWELLESADEVVFYRTDKEFIQLSPTRIYPNSAVVTVTVDENLEGLEVSDYFANIREIFKGAEYTEFSINGVNALEVLYSDDRIVDWYLYLDDEEVLVVYTEFGDGSLGYYNMQIIKTMLWSLGYKDIQQDEDYSELLSEIFENVLVEGVGMEMLDKLPDKLIIETDTIGVGTGPVDYYYSEGVDYTFKYERANDVILDTREGRTSAF